MPGGWRGRTWLGAMVLATAIVVTFLIWYGITEGPAFIGRLLDG